MLLSEQLALVAIDPSRGRPALGERSYLNAALAGLLVADLQLGTVSGPVLEAAQEVWDEKGPKVSSVLSAMDRGLERRLGTGTWDSAVLGLVHAGVLGPSEGRVRPRHELRQPLVRESLVRDLQEAAASDGRLEMRTAVLLSMVGPAHLLEVVAPDRKSRPHARKRIDHCLDDTELSDVSAMVRKVLRDAASAAAAGAMAAVVVTGS